MARSVVRDIVKFLAGKADMRPNRWIYEASVLADRDYGGFRDQYPLHPEPVGTRWVFYISVVVAASLILLLVGLVTAVFENGTTGWILSFLLCMIGGPFGFGYANWFTFSLAERNWRNYQRRGEVEN
jgi:hypothetical protein